MMQYQATRYLVGTLLFFVAGGLLVPLVCAFWWGESTVLAFMISIGLCLGVGWLLRHRAVVMPEDVTIREGFFAVVAIWLVGSLLGAVPFWLSGGIPHVVDAWFETVSGLTTTGASILTHIEALPKSLLLWRSLTHWLGGLGIVVMVIAILPSLGVGGLFLFRGEAGLTPERFTPRLVHTAQILFGIYSGLTAAETLLLLLCGMSLFDAVTHTFGTIATGGFSPRNASIAAYHSLSIELVVITFMVLGATNFGLYYRVLRGRGRTAWRNTEWLVFVGLLSLATLLITSNILKAGVYRSVPQALRDAALQTVSIGTTTGFATADFNTWPPFSQTLLLLLMFTGGCLGSTSGALRLGRLVLLGKLTTQHNLLWPLSRHRRIGLSPAHALRSGSPEQRLSRGGDTGGRWSWIEPGRADEQFCRPTCPGQARADWLYAGRTTGTLCPFGVMPASVLALVSGCSIDLSHNHRHVDATSMVQGAEVSKNAFLVPC